MRFRRYRALLATSIGLAAVLIPITLTQLGSGAAAASADKITYNQTTGAHGTYIQYVPGNGNTPTSQSVTGSGGCATPSVSGVPILTFSARLNSASTYSGTWSAAVVGAYKQRTGVCAIPQDWSIENMEALDFSVGTNGLVVGRTFSDATIQIAREDKNSAPATIELVEYNGKDNTSGTEVGCEQYSIAAGASATIDTNSGGTGPCDGLGYPTGFDTVEIRLLSANDSISVVGPTSSFYFKGSSTTTSSVFDASTNAAWSGTETTGAGAYDTSAVTGSSSTTPTGTVTYTYWTNTNCNGTGSPAGTETLTASGSVANSSTQTPLGAGAYSFEAVYSGDANFTGSNSGCEPFTVAQGSSTTGSVVFDNATNAAWTNTETAPAAAYDTSAVTPSGSVVPTGTVTYTYWTNGTCNGTGTSAGTETLTATGTVPNSNTESGLAVGSYSFDAVYSGDTNYAGSNSGCEAFQVVFQICSGNTITTTSIDTPFNGVGPVSASLTLGQNDGNDVCKTYTDFSSSADNVQTIDGTQTTRSVEFDSATSTGTPFTMKIDWGNAPECAPNANGGTLPACHASYITFDGMNYTAETFCTVATNANPLCPTSKSYYFVSATVNPDPTDCPAVPVTDPNTYTCIVETWSGLNDFQVHDV